MLKMSVGKIEIETTINGKTSRVELPGKTVEIKKITAVREKHITALRYLAGRKTAMDVYGYVDGRIVKTLLKHKLVSAIYDHWTERTTYALTHTGAIYLEVFGK